jgi:mRNA-degrading endonuclease RelE of RelBE toxin-antitoxin system
MSFRVTVKRKVEKNLGNLPDDVQAKLWTLVMAMQRFGPVRGEWPNYSKLGHGRHHCHLKPKWVACWRLDEGTSRIEVDYVGSREKAPY